MGPSLVLGLGLPIPFGRDTSDLGWAFLESPTLCLSDRRIVKTQWL